MIIKIHNETHSYTNNNITTESTYLYKKETPTGCRRRTFHPTIDTTAPNLNSSVTPEPGLWIHKDGSKVYLGSQTSQLSSSHRFPSTHNNPSNQLFSTQPVPPKRMDLYPSLPRSPSGSPSPLSRASNTFCLEYQCWNSQDSYLWEK